MNGIGQEGISQYYELNGNVYSSTVEIAREMNMSINSVNRSLNALFKYKLAEFKVVSWLMDYPNCHVYRKSIKLWRLKKK